MSTYEQQEPHWLALLRAEAQRSSMRAVAGRLGYSVATISLVLAGKYPGKTDKIAHASLQTLDSVCCPRLQRSLTIQECRAVALAPIPMHQRRSGAQPAEWGNQCRGPAGRSATLQIADGSPGLGSGRPGQSFLPGRPDTVWRHHGTQR